MLGFPYTEILIYFLMLKNIVRSVLDCQAVVGVFYHVSDSNDQPILRTRTREKPCSWPGPIRKNERVAVV